MNVLYCQIEDQSVRRCVLLSALVFFLIVGCGQSEKVPTEEELSKIPFAQKDGLPQCSGGLVLTVGGETITTNEIVEPLIEHFREFAQKNSFEQFKTEARPQVEHFLIAKLSNILLYNQAKKQISGEQVDDALEKAAEKAVRNYVTSFGGDYAKAQEELKQQGLDWKSFKESQKKILLTQHYVSTQLPDNKPITYSELVDCYNSMKEASFTTPATLTFRLIDIEVDKLQPADPNQSKLEQARCLANQLIERIKAGEDFGELAKQYSHDHRRLFGGLWKPVQPDSLAPPYNILAAEAEKTQQGQIAGPIEAPGHIFIMRLEEKQPKTVEPLENVQKQVEAKIIAERHRNAREEIGARLIQQASITNKDKFIDFCVQEIFRISNQ
jgi:parvulin-like peptidyl-prolyl isomerase